jgi:hypothetical protein
MAEHGVPDVRITVSLAGISTQPVMAANTRLLVVRAAQSWPRPSIH